MTGDGAAGETLVLKVGGSVVTEKDAPETVDAAALDRAAAAVAGFPGAVVLVHGGGSFGHHHASAWGVSRTDGSREAGAVRDVHGAMCRLNDAVCEALRGEGAAPVPVHPLSAARRDPDADLELPTGQVATMLAEGFLPVLHGDLVAHAGAGVTVVSGDELVVALARGLGADRVGVCSTVPGVLDDAGAVVPEITDFHDVADALGGSDSTDVTGGMAAKVRALLDLEAPATVFGPDSLEAYLDGERVGTRVDGRGR
ncbi:MAG: isopentenyl phosphate kinase [Halobacteriaceae archaeon]